MLQKYQSHKIVEAGKIQGLHFADDVLVAVTVGGQRYDVPPNFAARDMPDVGSYLVRYPDSDGYLSWSPAGAFEAGYTLMEEGDFGIGDIERAINEGRQVDMRPDGTVTIEGGAVAHKQSVTGDDIQQDGSADKDGVQS